jgi:peptide/nickel transport system ATP-binding protein/oligopeptide transport system ATP-binding protein
MIFQEPMTALNPVYTVGNQIMEVLYVHEDIEPDAARARAIEMLDKVGIPSPEIRIDEYPHQLSGGMRQRVMIAMALICNPEVLIADEPTTALDVTIQAQILELMNELQEKMGTSILLITHDLGVVAEVCDEVVVMYAGKIAEKAEIHALFENPQHPYTIALLRSLPSVEGRSTDKLQTIRGMVPSAVDFTDGCRFADRCDFASKACDVQPEIQQVGDEHWVACHHLDAVKKATGEAK